MVRAGKKVRAAMSPRRGRGAEGAAFPGVTQTTGDGAGAEVPDPFLPIIWGPRASAPQGRWWGRKHTA